MKNPYPVCEFVFQLARCHAHVVLSLQVDPEACVHAEEQPQAQRGIRRAKIRSLSSSQKIRSAVHGQDFHNHISGKRKSFYRFVMYQCSE
jgi:hypothetical protein